MSLSTMMIADLRAMNQDITFNKLNNTLQNLGTKWDPKDIMPPYIEIISGLFPANIMKKDATIKKIKGLSKAAQSTRGMAGGTQGTASSISGLQKGQGAR
jgi:hypothetical protein